jgi:uncharacterized protein YndB with AHSA1/START domain
MTTETLPRLVLERTLSAPRALVWNAWTDPVALARWWGPAGFANPRCEIDPRPGGAIRIDMLAPYGEVYPMDGRIEEIEPPSRLVFTSGALGPDGRRMFDILNILELEESDRGTHLKLDVRVTAIHDSAAENHLPGMEQGWTMSLERLAEALVERPTVFGAFTIRRKLKASPARVFAAFASIEAKRAWFAAPGGEWTQVERSLDFRVGGRERLVGLWGSGRTTDFDAVYQDIVPGRRIVYSYAMHLNNVRISVSLATIEFAPDGEGTKLTVSEHGAFLDGYDDAGAREKGTGSLLDRLGTSLQGSPNPERCRTTR